MIAFCMFPVASVFGHRFVGLRRHLEIIAQRCTIPCAGALQFWQNCRAVTSVCVNIDRHLRSMQDESVEDMWALNAEVIVPEDSVANLGDVA